MAFEGIVFPVYRKYKNSKNFYKIISPKSFEEKQIIGNRVITRLIQATQLPEFNHIHDLVYEHNAFAIEITEDEYVKVEQK